MQELAERHGIAVRCPTNLRDPAIQAEFAALGADVAVVAAYGLILPKPILDAPRHGCLNVHASLLPRWRGAAPIQRAILAGDRETGVTIMQMDVGLDTGADALARGGADRAEDHGRRIDRNAGWARRQAHRRGARPVRRPDSSAAARSGVTYAKKLSRDDARLDWRLPAARLERQVRAFDPWPGAFFVLGDERIRVLAAAVEPGRGVPGTVLDDAPDDRLRRRMRCGRPGCSAPAAARWTPPICCAASRSRPEQCCRAPLQADHRI